VMAAGAVLIYFTGPMMQALSQTRRSAVLEWCRTLVGAISVIAVALVVRHSSLSRQLMGIASARAGAVGLLVAPTFLYVLMRLCGLSLGDLAKSVAPSLLASGSVAGTVLLVQVSGVLGVARPWVSLLVQVATGAIVGVFFVLLFHRSLREEMLVSVRTLVGRSAKKDAAVLEACISETQHES
jgi:hypothetical protein